MKVDFLNFNGNLFKTNTKNYKDNKENKVDSFKENNLFDSSIAYSNYMKGSIHFSGKKASITAEALSDYINQYPEKNLPEIAKHFNTSVLAIKRLINKYGIEYQTTTHCMPVSEKELSTFIGQYAKESQAEITEELESFLRNDIKEIL